jgi:hypothetical protein
VARLVGAGAGSATERSYTLLTLPRGVARGLVDTLARCDPSGLARASAIMLGLIITIAGYLQGLAVQLMARRPGVPPVHAAGGMPPAIGREEQREVPA